MIDAQKTAVLKAMQSVDVSPVVGYNARSVCETYGLNYNSCIVRTEGSGMRVRRTQAEIGTEATVMTFAHALAHFVTSQVFPAHGAEFCENLLRVLDDLTVDAGTQLRQAFDERGVHYTSEHRKRAVIKSVIQRANDGTTKVDASFANPPRRVQGQMTYLPRAHQIQVGREKFDLDDLRYLSKYA